MAALPPVPKVIRIDLLQTFGGNTRVLDHFFLQYSGALSIADLTTILNTVSSSWNTNIVGILQNVHTLTGVRGTDLTSATSPQVQIAASRVGTGTGPSTPSGTAMVIRFKVNRRYRGGHPRFYLSGLANGGLATPETWIAANLATVQTDWSNFISGCIASPPAAVGTLAHVNVSYFQGFTNKTFPSGRTRPVPNLRPGGPVVDLVVSYSVNPNVASQRRRNQQSV